MNRPYRAEMGPPPMPDEGAPGPLTEKQRMGKMVVKGETPKGYRHRKEPDEGAPPVKKMASGGLSAGHKQADGIAKKGKTRGMEVKMAAGGLAAGHKQADGCAVRGKTKGMQVKMAGGGYGKC